MYLKTLHLRHFRNYSDQQIDFLAPKTILVGDNAQGKSNLLEAVELLSTLRSHRTTRDRELVQDGHLVGQIAATLERDTGSVELALTLRQTGRRTAALNSENLRRQLDFLGVVNSVQFSSLDLDLIRGGPDQRRHWLDALLMQLEPVYAHILHQYNQVLRQRNALLKEKLRVEGAKKRVVDPVLRLDDVNPGYSPPLEQQTQSSSELSPWNTQLVAAGARVIRRRSRVLERLAPLAAAWHQVISGSTEGLVIKYSPNVGTATEVTVACASASLPEKSVQLNSSEVVQQLFWEKLEQRSQAERYQGTTLVGPHRDDVEFLINDTPARQYGSQGQQRTLVLALKLAELRLIEEVVGEPPLLLLDDVLAELDLNRQNQLLDAVQDRFQTLITTTHLGSFDAQWLNSSQILTVKAGQIAAF